MAECGESHPDAPTRSCILPPGRHLDHVDRQGAWPNEAVINSMPKTKVRNRTEAKKQMAEVVAATRPRQTADGSISGPPTEAVRAWTTQSWMWMRDTERIFMDYLKTHAEPFTTPEDIWPLIRRPAEMRSMVVVVRRMVSRGLMAEVGAKRLSGTYHTREGDEFKMNKLVPIYQSLVAAAEKHQ